MKCQIVYITLFLGMTTWWGGRYRCADGFDFLCSIFIYRVAEFSCVDCSVEVFDVFGGVDVVVVCDEANLSK